MARSQDYEAGYIKSHAQFINTHTIRNDVFYYDYHNSYSYEILTFTDVCRLSVDRNSLYNDSRSSDLYCYSELSLHLRRVTAKPNH